MEEKIVFENVRTKTKKSFVIILILAYVCFVSFFFVAAAFEYTEHIVDGKHKYDCYNEIGLSLYADWEDCDGPFPYELINSAEGVDTPHCDYYGCTNVFEAFIKPFVNYDYILSQFIIVSVIWLIILSATICYVSSRKYKFNVTESSIYGKRGSKKFGVAFIDIVSITKKRKCVIIESQNKKFKLSPLKNYNEIYNFIKFRVPERKIEQHINIGTNITTNTETATDIKLF